MGKLAVVGASVLAGGGVSAGGVMLSRMFSFDSTLPKTLDDFKNGNGGGCVQSLFPGLEKMDGSNVNGTFSSPPITLENSKKSGGCLVINWDKEEYKKTDSEINGKEGKFRLLWAVQQESKGFIVFTTAETKAAPEKKLLGKGVAYTLEKKEADNTWSLSKKKEVAPSDKEMDESAVENKFPQSHADLNLKDKTFGGFMKDKGDMQKICDSSSCNDDTKKTPRSFEGYGEGKGPSNDTNGKKLGDGTSKLTTGWEELFGKTEWDMGEVVKDMTGKWEEKVGYGIEKPSNT